ncbi:hypothetical protein MES5069_460040 [Mesorhizobium escarrei]|uniref:Transposase n=1 Tax=Mesorhizobium escarrei TaxID=666018 RepID=A0ABM9E8X4_9HYPH|nr:hypothetical protein MES5069_460040 [Mesorhizobium escarrei]
MGLNVDDSVRPRGKLEVAFATAQTVSWPRGGGRTFGGVSFCARNQRKLGVSWHIVDC